MIVFNLNQYLDLREPSIHEEFRSIHETAVTRRQEQHRLFDFEFDTKLARTEIHFCDHNPKVLQIQRVYA